MRHVKANLPLKANKPVYIGMFILELSKVLMYDIHYDYIKNKYGNNARLLFTDTDSLIYEIKTEDVYYSTKSKYYDDSKKSVIGEMKDEMDVLRFKHLLN